jgi:hypothetical protein
MYRRRWLRGTELGLLMFISNSPSFFAFPSPLQVTKTGSYHQSEQVYMSKKNVKPDLRREDFTYNFDSFSNALIVR